MMPSIFLTTERHYRVDRCEISYLRFVIEACEGIAVMTTIEPGKGIIRLSVAPGREGEVDALIRQLRTAEGIRIEDWQPAADINLKDRSHGPA
ncbi:MAG: DUF4911 domain-containing protein [Desulfobacterales bacterium]